MPVCVHVAGERLKPSNPPACYRHVVNSSVLPLLLLTLIWLIEIVAIAATTFKLNKMSYQILSLKSKTLVEEVESKLEPRCKGSRGNIISKL